MRMFANFFVAIFLLSSPAYATPYSDGIAAYQRQDYQTALRLLEPLAVQGNTDAQLHIGILYGKGLGVPTDREKGVFWAMVGVNRGMKKMGFDPYDAGAPILDSATRRALETRARDWKPSPVPAEEIADWLADAGVGMGLLHQNGFGLEKNDAER